MRTTDVNKLQEAKKTGKPILGMSFQTTSPEDLVEMLGYAGLEWIYLDREHQPISWDTLANVIRSCELSGIFPMLRINKQYPGYPWEIRRAYEIGVGMVFIPHINTKEEALAAVRASKLGPGYEFGHWPADQIRGAGSMARGGMYTMATKTTEEWVRLENETRMIMVSMEEARAFENAEEILSVEGLDNLIVGPGDLATDMGTPLARAKGSIGALSVANDVNPEYNKLIEKYLSLRKKYPDKFMLNQMLDWMEVISNPEKAKSKVKKDIKEGAYVFLISSDQGILREVVKRCKKVIDEAFEEVKAEEK